MARHERDLHYRERTKPRSSMERKNMEKDLYQSYDSYESEDTFLEERGNYRDRSTPDPFYNRPARQTQHPYRNSNEPYRREYQGYEEEWRGEYQDVYEREYLENKRYDPRKQKRWSERDFPLYENDEQSSYPRRNTRLVSEGRIPENHRTTNPSSRKRLRPIDRNRELEWEKTQKETAVSRKKKLGSLFYNLFFYTFTIGLILMAVMFSFSSKNNASILGYRFYTVLTDSMVPQKDSPPGGFYSGDIVFLKVTEAKNIQLGNIVTYAVGDQGSYLTHRLVKRLDELNGEKGNFVVTKGDANKSEDPPISEDRVIGKVVYVIPKVGSLIEFVRSEFWLCLLCLASTFGFFLVLKTYLFSSDDGPKRPEPRRR